MKTWARATLVALVGVIALALPAAAQADTSITAYPAKPDVIGRHQVALYVRNGGDTAYRARIVTSVPWLVTKVSHVDLKPGQTAKLVVKVKKLHPHGQPTVTFLMPPPKGSGLAAQGGVAVPFNYTPGVATVPVPTTTLHPETGVPILPFIAAGALVLLAFAWFVKKWRARPKPSRSYGF